MHIPREDVAGKAYELQINTRRGCKVGKEIVMLS